MSSLISFLKRLTARVRAFSVMGWRRYRTLPKWQQIVLAVLLAVLVIGGIAFARSGGPADSAAQLRSVKLASVGELSGTGDSVSIIGSVRSVTEADILAQAGGTVRRVNATLGGRVGAGQVIAELENASERALVLQAEGAYDAAIAARSAVSPTDATAAARNTYRSAATAFDVTVESEVDAFYGEVTPYGPKLLINPATSDNTALSRERTQLETVRKNLAQSVMSAGTRDPEALLSEVEAAYRTLSTHLTNLATAANMRDSRVTAEQSAALASARATVNAQLAAIASAREAYRSRSVTSTASVDASVKSALGSLRGAQAQLEKTIIRAPIAGQVNFLPIRVGDYVTSFMHVATVAQNGALEIVAYVSEDDRELLAAGAKVLVNDTQEGIVTSIAPALDPTTKQIEVHVAVEAAEGLVNGQSVRIALPNAAPREATIVETAGPVLLPLASVKLRGEDRIVFTVGEDGRLIARLVQVGEVRGDRIEVTGGVTPDLRIVTDARGLAEGQQVNVAE